MGWVVSLVLRVLRLDAWKREVNHGQSCGCFLSESWVLQQEGTSDVEDVMSI
jgi:hypothetical protein